MCRMAAFFLLHLIFVPALVQPHLPDTLWQLLERAMDTDGFVQRACIVREHRNRLNDIIEFGYRPMQQKLMLGCQ